MNEKDLNKSVYPLAGKDEAATVKRDIEAKQTPIKKGEYSPLDRSGNEGVVIE